MRRALVLATVQILMLVHIAWWLVVRDKGGRVLSPIEPSESMRTLELGEINAGFIFFGLAILSTLVFGRFFCGWACHIVLLQDLCLWIMKKIGVTPKAFRSRLLVWAPLCVAVYMFVWPTANRVLIHPLLERIAPSLASKLQPPLPFNGWSNHLMVQDFWATFPTPLVTIPFLLVCGFAAVYFLGAKGFCTYGCPYGGFFGIADRFALARIRVTDACEGCGHCTAVCTSNVRVHEEVAKYRMVIDPGCMKCMDCVSVCPNNALHVGLARPTIWNAAPCPDTKPVRRVFDLTWPEEIVLAGLFLAAVLAWRSVYESVPLLMAVGIAGCIVFVAWKAWRLMREPTVRFHRYVLRANGRWSPAGWTWLGFTGLLAGLTVQAAVVRYHVAKAQKYASNVTATNSQLFTRGFEADQSDLVAASYALAHARRAASLARGGIGLLETPMARAIDARMHLVRGEYFDSEVSLRLYIELRGASDALCADAARLMILQGREEHASAFLTDTLALEPAFTTCAKLLAELKQP